MAISAGTIWECRQKQYDDPIETLLCGGGFDPAFGGVDYSQQDTAQLVVQLKRAPAGGPANLLSVYTQYCDARFTPEMVGNVILLLYEKYGVIIDTCTRQIIQVIDSTSILVDSWVALEVDGGYITGHVGGALGWLFPPGLPEFTWPAGNKIWMKCPNSSADSYLVPGPTSWPHFSPEGGLNIEGYWHTRGDEPPFEHRPAIDFDYSYPIHFTFPLRSTLKYLKVSCRRSTDDTPYFTDEGSSLVYDCTFDRPYIPGPDSIYGSIDNPKGSCALDLGAFRLGGTGEFFLTDVTGRGDPGIFSGGPTIAPLQLSGSGTFYLMDVTGDGDLDLGALSLSGVGTFSGGPIIGDGDFDLGPFSLTGVGTFSPPRFTADDSNLDLGPFSLSGRGVFTSLEFTGTSDLDLGQFTLTATGLFIPQSISAVSVTAPTASVNLMTYRDAIEHLIGFADGLAQEADQNRARAAIQSAYRDLAYSRTWKYLRTHARISLSAPYAAGTVTYASSTRNLTISGGAWPAWAADGKLRIDGHKALYKATTRSSGSTLVLDADFCPAADISTPTGYSLFRSIYDLPGDLWEMGEVIDESHTWSAGYVRLSDWMTLERRLKATGTPFRWTMMGSPFSYGQLAIGVYGYPSREETLDFIYTRRPRLLRLDGYDLFSSANGAQVKGVNSAGTIVTFSTSVQNPDGSEVKTWAYEGAMAGAVLRFCRPGANRIPKGFGNVDQWWQQKIIKAAGAESNQCVVDSPVAGGFGTEFTISDPVDLPEYCYDAFLVGCEYYYLQRIDPVRARAHYSAYRQAKLDAFGRDGTAALPDAVNWSGRGFYDPAWALLTGTITPSAG